MRRVAALNWRLNMIRNVPFVFAAALSAVTIGNPASASPLPWTAGHGDLAVGYEDGELEWHYHFGSDAVIDGSMLGGTGGEYAVDDIIVIVPEKQKSPAGRPFPNLGIVTGEDRWVIPSTPVADVPYTGFGAEELPLGQWTGNKLFVSMTGFSGPGNFSVYHFPDGDLVSLISTVPAYNPGFDLFVGSHVHYVMGFTAPGRYEVTLTAQGTHNVDGFKSDSATFVFQVIPEPTTAALLVMGGAALLVRRRRNPS
jgi:surface-anchored protein